MNTSAHILLAKREEQERDRLATELAALLLQHKSMQEDINAATRDISDIETQLQHSFAGGMKGSQLMAMECARQELMTRCETLSFQCDQLRDQERQLRQRMMACENKGKAHTRAQAKLDMQMERRSDRIAQQRIDDLMAQRLNRNTKP